ncbi:hypothetical protein LNV47_24740, partial [Paucibacter sp. DJ4R-1]|nr:hypothetical protein [Paucibacter sp. DJ4R-1]
IVLVIVILETDFFERKFGVSLESERDASGRKNHNDRQLHMIIYLQVAMISQALIFITRSHGFFFMERPSTALLGAFAIAQLVSSIIAAYADWGFTDIHSISGGWIGIVWVWNIVWFFPLDWIKFAMKATIIRWFRERRERKAAAAARATGGEVPLTRTTSRAASIHESLYSNRVSFLKRAARRAGFGDKRVRMSQGELQRFSSIQAAQTGATLARNPSRPH